MVLLAEFCEAGEGKIEGLQIDLGAEVIGLYIPGLKKQEVLRMAARWVRTANSEKKVVGESSTVFIISKC